MADYAQWNDATTPLSGDELAVIFQNGNEVKTEVSNFGGGAAVSAILVESGSSKKISQLPGASHPLSVTNPQEGVPAVQVDGDDDLVNTFLTRGNLLGTPLTNITRTFLVVGMGPNSLVGHEYSTIMCEATGALTLQLGDIHDYDTEAQGATYTIVMASEPGASVEIDAPVNNSFNWGSNFSPNGGTLTTTQPGSSITITGNPDGFVWYVESFEGTWTMTTTGSPVTFTSPSAGGGGVQTAQVSLSSAQLLALNATPVLIVAAPGAGKVLSLLSVMYDYVFVTTPYTEADPVRLCYNSDPSLQIDAGATFDGGTSVSSILINPSQSQTGGPTASLDNSAIWLAVPSAMTAGDGTLKVTANYLVLTR